MLLSISKRFVILFPWKTASSTINTRIGCYNESPYSSFFYYNKHIETVTHQHITLAQFLRLPESKTIDFKATFVRNPYDRAWSAFQQIKRDILNQPMANFPDNWIRDLVLEQLRENKRALELADGNFDLWVKNLKYHDIYCVAKNSNLILHPIHFWTHNDNALTVDFIGRVEQFESDFKKLVDILNLTPQNSLNVNVSDDHSERPPNQYGYKHTHRMDNKTIEKLNEMFYL